MNVFYNTDTRGLKELPAGLLDDCGTTAYFTRLDVFIIDCEGCLYRADRFKDGSFNTDNFVDVDFVDTEQRHGVVMCDFYTAVQDCLEVDAINDPSGWYFKSAS